MRIKHSNALTMCGNFKAFANYVLKQVYCVPGNISNSVYSLVSMATHIYLHLQHQVRSSDMIYSDIGYWLPWNLQIKAAEVKKSEMQEGKKERTTSEAIPNCRPLRNSNMLRR